VVCPPDTLDAPPLDYLARDYASFRQMLLDLVSRRNPTWIERSPADLGIALLELFAYEGDHQSYFQDAVANEAFLDTARQRVSAKRHARLVDYQMHDGRNAWAFVHFQTGSIGSIVAGSQLVTRITSPMRFDRSGAIPVPQPTAPPGPILHEITDLDYQTDPALAQVRVFETAIDVAVDPLNNELRIHTWGNDQCCLGVGRTTAHIYAVDASGTAVRPSLPPGTYLLLEEVIGPTTGARADANPAHRQVVQIERVSPDPSTNTSGAAADNMHDKLLLAAMDPLTGEPKPVIAPVPLAQTLPLVEVTWRKADALKFPLCISAKLKDGTIVPRISVARGNIAVADQGRTVREPGKASSESFTFVPPLGGEPGFRLRLAQGPLTLQCAQRGEPRCDAREAVPAIKLEAWRGATSTTWSVVPSLLASDDFAPHFVADIDDVGRAVLRFGDGEYGQMFTGIDRAEVTYRIGNGISGNIGAESLAHIVLATGGPSILSLRNPLAAEGGVNPELIEQVRNYAPAAFRARQFRAVTEQDYRDAALTVSGVAGAVASFRWTGSWYTAFVGIDPSDADDAVTDARGVTRLDAKFKQKVLDTLTRYRLAGYDIEIRAARYVPIDLALQLCVKPGYFRGDVAYAVSLALGSVRASGGLPGLFDPANFSFGQPVYLSRIYAAVKNVDGVESAAVTAFHRHGRDPAGEIETGQLPIGAWEIARLDNDRSNLENGSVTIAAGGGS
jgi:hypothetical protein